MFGFNRVPDKEKVDDRRKRWVLSLCLITTGLIGAGIVAGFLYIPYLLQLEIYPEYIKAAEQAGFTVGGHKIIQESK